MYLTFTTGRNEWPKTLVDAYRTLSNWKRENTGSVQLESEGVSFGTDGATEGAGKDYSNALCWRCRKRGHLKRDCTEPNPDSGTEGNANVQDGAETGEQLLLGAIEDGEFDNNIHFSFFGAGTATMDDDVPTVDVTDSKLNKSVTLNINTSKVTPGTWILLDNQSTHGVFSNPNLLRDIRRVSGSLRIHTQAGTTTTSWKGDQDGYGPVWFCKGGIANILSLSKVRE